MKKQPITNNTDTMNTAHAAAYIAIRARHQASGLDLMRRLNQTQHADRQREDLPRIASEALEARRAHDMHREAADTLQAIADRVSTPQAQAEAAAIEAVEHRAAAARELETAERLERVISTTSHSDRADISQAAALAYVEFMQEHSADEYEDEDEYNREAFAAACKAAGKTIGAVAAAHGCTATRTKVKPITAEEAHAIMEAYPNTDHIPFNVREGLTAGYITIEHRDSKHFPRGWYKVKHYHTAAPYISYEVFASGEATEEISEADNTASVIDTLPQFQTNGGINAITNAQAAEDIAALFDRAKLSERERLICRYMTDNTAAAAGIKAVAQHQAETAERIKVANSRKYAREIQREADRRTEDIRAAAQRENAMYRAGIYSKANQDNVISRIRAKLEKAKSAPTERPTAAELDRRMWERMQANRDRYSRDRAAAPVTMIKPTITAYTDRNAKPTAYAAYDVQWVENYPTPQALTAEEQSRAGRAEQERRQHQSAHAADIIRAEYRRAFTQGRATKTAYAALDAQVAALVFFDHMSRAEQFQTIADAIAAEAAEAHQRAAEAQAKAEAKHEVKKHVERAAELAELAKTAPKHRREELKEAAEMEGRAAERAAKAAYNEAAALIEAAEAITAKVATIRAAAKA